MEGSGSTVVGLPLSHDRIMSTPAALINRYVRRSQKTNDIEHILRTRPILRRIVLRLAAYLTELLPGDDGKTRSLMEQSLNTATSEWVFYMERSAEAARANAYFLRGLLAALPRVLDISVSGWKDGHWVIWDPTERGLRQWAKTLNGGLIVLNSPPDGYWREMLAVEFRMLVLSRFLCREAQSLSVAVPYLDFIVART